MKKTSLALVLAALVAVPASSLAYEASVFKGTSAKATASDLLPHAGAMDKTFYSENYLLNCDMEGKARLQVKLGASNVLGKSGSGFADVTFAAPGIPSQKLQKTVGPGKWSVSKALPFKLQVAGTELSGDDQSLHLTASTSRARLKVDFTATTPGWKPGNGRVELGDQGYFAITVWPALDVKGTVTDAKNGKAVPVTGRCIFNHAVSTLPPELMPDRWFYFRTEGEGAALLFQALQLPEAWGGKSFGWVVGVKDGKLILSASRLELAQSDVRPRGDINIPWALIGKDPAAGVECAVKGSKLRKVVDRLRKLPAFEAALVRKFINPIRYLFDAQMECSATNGTKVRASGEFIVETLR